MDNRVHELAHWLGQKKTTVRERKEAKKELEKWFKRAKFAVEQGKLELAQEATTLAKSYQEEFRKVTARLIEIETELEKLRAEKVIPNEAEFKAAQARAEHTASEFAKMGVDPKFAAIDPRFAKLRVREELDGSVPDALLYEPSPLEEAEQALGDFVSPSSSSPPSTDPLDDLDGALAEADGLLDLPFDPDTDDEL
ncbi:MAG: hypothetical protein ACJAYU_000596 [Bradymonadia bacterium]|jgi:hypothetical protein